MEAEAEAVAASLQRSRAQIRTELLEPDSADGLAGLVPSSAIMGFLLAPSRRGPVLAAVSALMSLLGRNSAASSGMSGLWRLAILLLGLSLRGRR